jgi:GNAT superfamily N-acetyltransferase
VLFTPSEQDDNLLVPLDLEVDERYRGQGIGATMYDHVKSLGYTIRRSQYQTDAGAGFWDKHKSGKNVWEQGMAENFADGKNPGRKGLSKRMGVNTKASVSSLRKTAKNSTGEKQRMAHWLANMKSGRLKNK